ncbi:MAG TPA: phosphotransferase, partial [Arenicellales bacterium]|nr:phosphotransferase [Arenicellales bacterium]
MDERFNILSRWVEEIIGPPASMRPASADASFRRYFRVLDRDGRSYIAMDAPPEHESVETFARVAERFREAGLNVPQVHAIDTGRGLALLGDLGNRTYLAEINDANADLLYRDALEALYRLQAFSIERLDTFELYDAGKLNAEMELFRQWFVP